MRAARTLIGKAVLLALVCAGAAVSFAEAPRPFAVDA